MAERATVLMLSQRRSNAGGELVVKGIIMSALVLAENSPIRGTQMRHQMNRSQTRLGRLPNAHG
jgi:hypothetical protein